MFMNLQRFRIKRFGENNDLLKYAIILAISIEIKLSVYIQVLNVI